MALAQHERLVVLEAQRQGLLDPGRSPDYLPPGLCTLLSIVLTPFTLGFSLILMPILWVAQYDITATRIARLRAQLGVEAEGAGAALSAAESQQTVSEECLTSLSGTGV